MNFEGWGVYIDSSSNWSGLVLKGPGVEPRGGVFLGNPKHFGREDWGTLGKIRGITTPPEESDYARRSPWDLQ